MLKEGAGFDAEILLINQEAIQFFMDKGIPHDFE